MTVLIKHCVIALQAIVLPLAAHAVAPNAPRLAASPTLQRIAASGHLVIGHRVAACPFSCLDAAGQPIGYSIELCKRIVPTVQAAVGKPLEVEYVAVTPASRIDALRSGLIHIECGTTTITRERQKQVDFSYITYVTRIRALALPANAAKYRVPDGRALIEAGPVAYVKGTSTAHILEHLYGAGGLHVIEVADYAAGIAKVRAGEALSVIGDETLLADANKRAGGLLQWTGQNSYSVEPYGLPLAKDAVFQRLVNDALGRLYATGEATRLLAQSLAGLKLEYNQMAAEAIRHPSTTAQIVW